MKKIAWNLEKNEWLKENRGVCFEQVVNILDQAAELDVIDHPNQERYPGQRMIVVNINPSFAVRGLNRLFSMG